MRAVIKLKDEQVQVFNAEQITLQTTRDYPTANLVSGSKETAQTLITFNIAFLVYCRFE